MWKLSAEPGVTTQAPPTGDLAPDEEDELLDQPTAPRTYIYDPEVGDEDSDGDYDFPGVSSACCVCTCRT